jgi:hypothetical protein
MIVKFSRQLACSVCLFYVIYMLFPNLFRSISFLTKERVNLHPDCKSPGTGFVTNVKNQQIAQLVV